MKISIFKDLTYVTEIDCSYTPWVEYKPEVKDEESCDIISEEILWVPAKWNIDCIECVDMEFDPKTQNLEISQKKWKLSFNITEKDIQEDDASKKSRILALLVSSEDYQSVDSEWVFLEYSDIWPAIIARFFKSDPNAEMAYLQKWNFLTSFPDRTAAQQNELDLIKQWYIAKEKFKDFLLTLINK